MAKKLKEGQQAPPLHVKTIHGTELHVPGDEGELFHVQFRRFAGCPICNLHLQSFRQRHAEIESAGVREIVIFHSSVEELLPFQGQFPFAVVGDPKKQLYRLFGVESSISAFLGLSAWLASAKGIWSKDKPDLFRIPNGGFLGLPADFLIGSNGVIAAAHYGRHAYDQWSVDDLLALAAARPTSGR